MTTDNKKRADQIVVGEYIRAKDASWVKVHRIEHSGNTVHFMDKDNGRIRVVMAEKMLAFTGVAQ